MLSLAQHSEAFGKTEAQKESLWSVSDWNAKHEQWSSLRHHTDSSYSVGVFEVIVYIFLHRNVGIIPFLWCGDLSTAVTSNNSDAAAVIQHFHEALKNLSAVCLGFFSSAAHFTTFILCLYTRTWWRDDRDCGAFKDWIHTHTSLPVNIHCTCPPFLAVSLLA